VQGLVTSEQWARFHCIRGDIRNLEDCRQACGSPSRFDPEAPSPPATAVD